MHKFEFTGKGSDIFFLYLKNVFLIIITSGIYYFWASVNFKRYFYRNTLFDGIPFDYSGTGKELFTGFLKTLILFSVVVFFFILTAFFLAIIVPGGEYISAIMASVFLFSLNPLIKTGSRRYLLSRSSWNGIRFRFRGSPQELFKIQLKGFLITVLTFGIYLPFWILNYQKFLIGNSVFGQKAEFRFSAQGKDYFILLFKGFFLTFITFGIYSFKFNADLINFFWNLTFLKGVPFRSKIKGIDIFIFSIKSFLMIFFSLGIAVPWVIAAYYRLRTESLELLPGAEIEKTQRDEETIRSKGTSPLPADHMDSAADPFLMTFRQLDT